MVVVMLATWPAKGWLAHYKAARNGAPDSYNPRNSHAHAAEHGVLGDFVNIRLEKARYGSDLFNADAMPGLSDALTDSNNYTADGAVSVGMGDSLVGRDMHRDVQKSLRFTFSAELHGGKPLTIRPRDRMLPLAPASAPSGNTSGSTVIDAMVIDARNTYGLLPFSQKQALKIIYTSPGLSVANVSKRLEKLEYVETAQIVHAIHKTNLIHFTPSNQIYPSTNEGVAMEVERLLKELGP
jgi:hypothetical protein